MKQPASYRAPNRRILPPLAAAFLISLTQGARAAGEFIISEFNYNAASTDVNGTDWMEIKNVGDAPLSTTGFTFEGSTVTPAKTVQPGGHIVLAVTPAQFAAKFGFAADGTMTSGLSGSGETIEILQGVNTVFSVKYWDGGTPADSTEEGRNLWPSAPDGNGYTLTLFDSSKAPEDPDDYRNWRPSINLNGSPKANEPLPTPLPVVVVNEIRSRDGNLDNDWVEVYNPSATPVDISTWYLSASLNNPKQIDLPAGSIVPAGGYLVFQNGDPGISLGLSSKNGERIFLYSATAAGALTGYVNGFFFGPSGDGTTFSRYLDSQNRVRLVTTLPTRGAANGLPFVGPVVITEIMYDPGVPGGNDEFLEIQNISEATVPLYNPLSPATNWRVDGISFVLNGVQPSLAPGEIALVVPTVPSTFRAAHAIPANVQIFGPYAVGASPPSLRNGGERVALQRPDTNEGIQTFVDMDAVEYDNKSPWPEAAAGGLGRSLVRVDVGAYGDDPVNWAASLELGGSPGRIVAYSGPVIYVNEILAHTDLPQTDAIELYNPNASPVDIGGWFLSDSRNSPKKFKIPTGTMIPAGGYWVVNEDNDDNTATQPPAGYFGTPGGFALSENGESVVLSSANAAGVLTGYQDRVVFDGTDNGVSVGRVVDTQGRVDIVPLSSITFTINRFVPNPAGAVNSAPKIGPVVISELLYNPDGADPEFIEITNITGGTVALYDNSPGGNPANNWLFSAGVTFSFPGATPTLAAGARMIILPQGTDAAVFRTANSVPPAVVIHGGASGYTGALNNGGEKIVLAKKGPPNADEGFVAPIVPVDYVDYSDVAPWPNVGVLGGRSIERKNLTAYGSNYDNWKTSNALNGSPGTANSMGFVYDTWALANFTPAELAMTALVAPNGDFNGDGITNLNAYAYAFSPKTFVNQALLPQMVVGTDSGQDFLGLSFRMRSPANDLTYLPQFASDLIDWSGVLVQFGAATPNGDGTVTVVYRDPGILGAAPRRFFRVKVTKP